MKCQSCGKEFEFNKRYAHKKFCSEKCRYHYQRLKYYQKYSEKIRNKRKIYYQKNILAERIKAVARYWKDRK